MTIKSIDSTVLRNHLSDALKEVVASRKPLIIKQRNKPRAVILGIDEFEDYLASQDPEYIRSIALARQEAVAGKGRLLSVIAEETFGSIE